jgi:c-di-GMP-binding flagellar brake protein YcgR
MESRRAGGAGRHTMNDATAETSILLVDDGELDGVAELLESQGRDFMRLRGAAIPQEIPPPRDLLVVTPRRLGRVRRGSPRDAAPGYPLRIIAVEEDSPAMRRRLRSAGAQLLVRLPSDDEIWRLLIARALYRGHERRRELRVNIGSPVDLDTCESDALKALPQTTLVDLSNRGCRLRTSKRFRVDEPIRFTIPATAEDWDGEPSGLPLRGRVRRIVEQSGTNGQTVAITFDPDLPQKIRTSLARLINLWASGPRSVAPTNPSTAPSIPPCRLPSLPDLTLDDETDPPVQSRTPVGIEIDLDQGTRRSQDLNGDRRNEIRGQFESTIVAESSDGPIVLLGRDLSPGGMRVESVGDLKMGDQFRLALHGPGPSDPIVVRAEVVREDGRDGFALAFLDLDERMTREIEKIVDCLPGVESLERSEFAGMGAILSELIPD